MTSPLPMRVCSTSAGFASQHLVHARTYVPMLGRFTRPDPANSFSLFNPQSFNRYSYVGNNPVNYVDPFGLAEVSANSAPSEILQEYCRRTGIACPTGTATASVTVTAKGPSDFSVQAKRFADRVAFSLFAPAAGLATGTSRHPFRDIAAMGMLAVGAKLPMGSVAGSRTSLFRAVSGAELTDITATGTLRLIPGIESKYFATTAVGAAKEGKMLYRLTGGTEGGYTIVKTSISSDAIPAASRVAVDGGVDSVVLEGGQLGSLARPEVLNYTPLPWGP